MHMHTHMYTWGLLVGLECADKKLIGLSDTEADVQGGTEIQVVYPTDLYLSTILLQFEQSVYKYLQQNLQCRQKL